MATKQEWGNATWYLLHTLAFNMREEYFEELDDAGVYEYYCNGSVAFNPYYESDATGGYVGSGRPKVWYKWDPKTGVINKS